MARFRRNPLSTRKPGCGKFAKKETRTSIRLWQFRWVSAVPARHYLPLHPLSSYKMISASGSRWLPPAMPLSPIYRFTESFYLRQLDFGFRRPELGYQSPLLWRSDIGGGWVIPGYTDDVSRFMQVNKVPPRYHYATDRVQASRGYRFSSSTPAAPGVAPGCLSRNIRSIALASTLLESFNSMPDCPAIPHDLGHRHHPAPAAHVRKPLIRGSWKRHHLLYRSPVPAGG